MGNMVMRIRWSDNDRYWGPFTYARKRREDDYRPLAVVLGSGDGDDYPGCRLRVSGFGHTLILALPAIIKPWRHWVDTSHYSWSKSPNGGYWDVHRREYGFSLSEGILRVLFGAQTGDSSTTQDWSWFLPWCQWRFVRKSYYGLDGEHYGTEERPAHFNEPAYERNRQMQESCPTASFAFADFDGERLTAKTRIEEWEWRFGEGWFKWLSLFRRPKVRRSLDIRFSGETGARKGSWKGGTIGHSMSMLPGELHEAAFRRYCANHAMTFEGAAA